MKMLMMVALMLTFLAGQSGVDFLKIGVGARAMAMAGAYTGIAEGAEASYWNPAGLAQIEHIELAAMHLQWSTDIMYEFLSYAQKFPTIGAFGLGISYLGFGDIDARDEFGQSLTGFSAYDVCGMFSFARPINEQLNIGANAKLFQEKIGDDNATGYALDIGGLYSLAKARFGLSLRNLGMKLKFVDEEFSLPMIVSLGVSYYPLGSQLVLALAGDYQIESERGNVRFGAEYWIQEMLAVRAGYQYKTKDDELGILNGFGAGLGVKKMKFGIDYGYEPSSELGDIHRLSLKLNI